jgi:cellulose synthase operon protein C
MDCSTLPSFLDDELGPESRAQFERHLVECAACQREVEAAMQLYALGTELAERRDRPHATANSEHTAKHGGARGHRRWQRFVGVGALAVAAAVLLIALGSGRNAPTLDTLLSAELMPRRQSIGRLPYAPLDRHREYDTVRAATAPGEKISMAVLAQLEANRDDVGLIAAQLARGELPAAENLLLRAGSSDDLNVERAFIAAAKRQNTVALSVLDQVLRHTPRHAQALWNRSTTLVDLELPLVAAEAFDSSAALSEPGWSTEAAARRDELRHRERERAASWKADRLACGNLADGTLPDLAVVRRRASVCRPALLDAVRRAETRDATMQLLAVAREIDAASGDTASSDLVTRIAAADFRVRGPSVAIYRKLTMTPDLATKDKALLVDQLRASHQDDLVLGALPRAGLLPDHMDEYVRLAYASRDPFLEELAVEREADAQLRSGRSLEAELALREATRRCAAHDVERRCAYLHLALVRLYLKRHRPGDATETALVALQRSRRLGLYWDERLLFDFLALAARLARDYSVMRAYVREAALRDQECAQLRMSQEIMSDAELGELRFANARAELDRAPTCQESSSPFRIEIEAKLAHIDGTPDRTRGVRDEINRIRSEATLTRGELAALDASEGWLVAASDPVAARPLLTRAIEAADTLGIDDVTAIRARSAAYTALLSLGARDLDGAALLDLFAAAGRVRARAGCALGALVDGTRLLLLARNADGQFEKVFEPNAFKTPDFDARTLVPAAVTSFLSRCSRVDVIALPPLFGQPHLLPAQLAWSYRGPAGTPAPSGSRRPVVLTIEDTTPPAALGLAPLRIVEPRPRATEVDEVVLRGAQATPEQVRRQLPFADVVEIHAHGFVDLGISDVSLIALSPQSDGSFALTAREIAALQLKRAPFITLAACHAAYTAPYMHEPWSLPFAFLMAGARGVLAPATAIPDKEAGAFFRTIDDQILQGLDPAIVLRDQRILKGSSTGWVNDVVLFD